MVEAQGSGHRRNLQRPHRSDEPAHQRDQRAGGGFSNFDDYRLRLLLSCGVDGTPRVVEDRRVTDGGGLRPGPGVGRGRVLLGGSTLSAATEGGVMAGERQTWRAKPRTC